MYFVGKPKSFSKQWRVCCVPCLLGSMPTFLRFALVDDVLSALFTSGSLVYNVSIMLFENSFTIAPVLLYRVVRVSGNHIAFVTLFQSLINIIFWCCWVWLRCLWKSVVKSASSAKFSIDKILCCLAVIILKGKRRLGQYNTYIDQTTSYILLETSQTHETWLLYARNKSSSIGN